MRGVDLRARGVVSGVVWEVSKAKDRWFGLVCRKTREGDWVKHSSRPFAPLPSPAFEARCCLGVRIQRMRFRGSH